MTSFERPSEEVVRRLAAGWQRLSPPDAATGNPEKPSMSGDFSGELKIAFFPGPALGVRG